MNGIKKGFLLAMLIVFVNTLSYAQISVMGTSPQTINFNGFDGTGFVVDPVAGQLDSDDWSIMGLSQGTLEFGGEGITSDFAQGITTGGVTSGGIYAFDLTGGNFALGVQPTGSDFTPGSITLRMQNNTGAVITALDIAYNLIVNNDNAEANSFNFSHSADNIVFAEVVDADYTSEEVAATTPAFESIARNIEI